MKLSELLLGISCTWKQGEQNPEIQTLQYDSRFVKAGDVFFCITGLQTDGHLYAEKAIAQGATAIICEKVPQNMNEDTTVFVVEDSRKALALAAANYYGRPAEALSLIGVTGTNGKTTTTYLLQAMLTEAGHKVGLIGTIENQINGRILHAERTTPESLELQELFAKMKDEGVTHVVMEVSSHSLALSRVEGLTFDVGIFTNLTQDHLDFHHTMENYKEAKALLFERSKISIVNLDDPVGMDIKKRAAGKIITYAIEQEADLQAEDIHIAAEGVRFQLDYAKEQYSFSLHTPGRFSIYNALGAIGAGLGLGLSLPLMQKSLKEYLGVSGRFQTIKHNGISAIVDYAHTPDGLKNILLTAKEFVTGEIITVFGCGGDRDRTKRPIMGEMAASLSDFCIITSDNPRTEDPASILDEVEVGVQRTNCPYHKLVDRREAIRYAIRRAKAGDAVMIAGKGHENYQIFADKTIHFDDVEEVRAAFGEELQ